MSLKEATFSSPIKTGRARHTQMAKETLLRVGWGTRGQQRGELNLRREESLGWRQVVKVALGAGGASHNRT